MRRGQRTTRRSRIRAMNCTWSHSGTGRYRVEDQVTDVGPGDLLFCAAQVTHGFEDISDDFLIYCIVRPLPAPILLLITLRFL